VLSDGRHPSPEQIADGEAHDGIPDWVVKRLVLALLGSAGENPDLASGIQA
jgi:hypothetical protein